LRRLAAALGSHRPHTSRLSGGAVWLTAWLGLLAIYATQETLEGLLATGHPGGAGGVVGHGGWWAIPAAAAVAAVVTVLLLAGGCARPPARARSGSADGRRCARRDPRRRPLGSRHRESPPARGARRPPRADAADRAGRRVGKPRVGDRRRGSARWLGHRLEAS